MRYNIKYQILNIKSDLIGFKYLLLLVTSLLLLVTLGSPKAYAWDCTPSGAYAQNCGGTLCGSSQCNGGIGQVCLCDNTQKTCQFFNTGSTCGGGGGGGGGSVCTPSCQGSASVTCGQPLGSDGCGGTCTGVGTACAAGACNGIRCVLVPNINISTDPTIVKQDTNFNLSWFVQNAQTCNASGSWTGNQPMIGVNTYKFSNFGNYAFTLTCTSATGDTTSRTALITVTDGTPPIVKINSPANNTKVSGAFDVNVSATDNTTVNRMEILIDGNLVAGQPITSPQPSVSNIFSIDTINLGISDGIHTLSALASDPYSNQSSPATITINVYNGLSTCRNLGTPRLNALLSTPEFGGKFGGTAGVCVIGFLGNPLLQAVMPSFKLSSYSTLKSIYFTQSKFANKGALPGGSAPTSFSGDGLYLQNSDLNINNAVPPGSAYAPGGKGTQVIFVEGNLNISRDIIYHTGDNDGGLVFVVNGNINISQNVGQIDALLISGGTICTNSLGGNCSNRADDTLKQLTVNGNMASLDPSKKIQFARDLSLVNLAGNRNPAEIITMQPKYAILLKDVMSQTFTYTFEDTNYAINLPGGAPAPIPSLNPLTTPTPTPAPTPTPTPIPATKPPGAPVLTASSGSNQVNLSWTAPTPGTSAIISYKVYKSTTSGNETFLAATSGTTFVDTNVTIGSTYYYMVSAVNSTSEGPKSNEASITLTYFWTGGVWLDYSGDAGAGNPQVGGPSNQGATKYCPSGTTVSSWSFTAGGNSATFYACHASGSVTPSYNYTGGGWVNISGDAGAGNPQVGGPSNQGATKYCPPGTTAQTWGFGCGSASCSLIACHK